MADADAGGAFVPCRWLGAAACLERLSLCLSMPCCLACEPYRLLKHIHSRGNRLHFLVELSVSAFYSLTTETFDKALSVDISVTPFRQQSKHHENLPLAAEQIAFDERANVHTFRNTSQSNPRTIWQT